MTISVVAFVVCGASIVASVLGREPLVEGLGGEPGAGGGEQAGGSARRDTDEFGVVTLEARGGRITHVRMVLNPEKLSLWT
jgi:hypothetical protein